MSYEPPSPQLFSFNSPIGMCPDCNGLGMRHGFPMHHIVADAEKSIQKGAILLLPSLSKFGRWPRHILTGAAEAIEQDCGMEPGSLLKSKWSQLPAEAQQKWLFVPAIVTLRSPGGRAVVPGNTAVPGRAG